MDDPTVAAVFLAGVVTILTPCCLPMIPVLVVGANGHSLRPVAIVTGSTIMFTILGVLTGLLGSVTPDTIRAPFAVGMLVFGVVMADDDVNQLYSKYSSRFAGRATSISSRIDEQQHPLGNGLLVGVFLGAIWLPCVGPILGGVLAYVGTMATVEQGTLLLFVYGVGFSIPLLLVAYVGQESMRRVLAVSEGTSSERFRTITGYAFVLLGVAILFDIDRLALASVVELG